MSKKIRFPLKMKDGAEVRNVNQLQNEFYLPQVLAYILDGTMIRWLRDRYEDRLADQVETLDCGDENLAEKYVIFLEWNIMSQWGSMQGHTRLERGIFFYLRRILTVRNIWEY